MKFLVVLALVLSPNLAFPQSDSSSCDLKCTRIFKPVCGSDGKTYNNKCLLDREKCVKRLVVEVVRPGPCEDNANAEETTVKTSEAVEDVETIEARKQEPECPTKCRRDFRPVCGSDGKTHPNECTLELNACRQRISIEKVHDGRCGSQGPKNETQNCNEDCKKDFRPVCGSNGKTYNNLCLLEQDGCTKRIRITKLHDGQCKEGCRRFCPLLFAPVCGSDGNTYGNECQLKTKACREDRQNDLVVAKRGACQNSDNQNGGVEDKTEKKECQLTCPTRLDLVCGTDGVTYTNECNLKAVACHTDTEIKIASKGKCGSIVFEPVEAEDESLEVITPPLAECSVHCPQLFQPVCASNGETFNNPCELGVAKNCRGLNDLTQVSDGPCPENQGPIIEAVEFEEDFEVQNCPDVCIQIFQPVCGTDGVTYSNECFLEMEACKSMSNLQVASKGECEKPIIKDCPDVCFEVFSPVCGTDGVTYSNECFLEIEACKSMSNLQVAFKGECKKPIIEAVELETEDCPDVCAQVFEPVCGTDGVTYSNECFLEIEACKSMSNLQVASKGECERPIIEAVEVETEDCEAKRCTFEINPVCGSDGNVYENPCLFENAVCLSKGKLTLASNDAICEE